MPRKNNVDPIRLIEEFSFAAKEIIAMLTANDMAKMSEANADAVVSQLFAQNGLYVTPHDMNSEVQAEFAAVSADAQLKRMQSSQISAATQSNLIEHNELLNKAFVKKKLHFTASDPKYKPFESVWFNPQTGGTDTVLLKTNSITGVVENINLEQNLVVLRPSLIQRKLNPNRGFLLVYIINPVTLDPAVTVS